MLLFKLFGRFKCTSKPKPCTLLNSNVRTLSHYNKEVNVVRANVPNITIPNKLLEEYIWKDLHKWHDKTALVCCETGRSYTYSDLYKKSKILANFLHTFPNLKQTDKIAIILPNIPEYPIILLGASQAGLVITTVNPDYTTDEISKQLLASDSKLIFTLVEHWQKVQEATEKLNKHIPLVLIKHQQNNNCPRGHVKFDEIVEGSHELTFRVTRSVDDLLFLPYSSGTTGVPKGVELTHKSVVSNLYQMASKPFQLLNTTDGSDQEVTAAILPFFHLYGLNLVLLNMLSIGGKLVTLPKYSGNMFLKVLKEYRLTFGYLIPPLVLFLMNNPHVRLEDMAQMRTILCGAAPLGAADIERFDRKWNGRIKILQVYGLTETSPITHIQTPHLTNGIKLGGTGFPITNTECKVVSTDDSQITLGPNQSGELLVRGPQVMKGYYKNVQATQAVIDADGWLKTGDIVHYDEDGHFFITDRFKELIKVSGFQVAPAELEALLRNHPDIEDAAVVGVLHDKFGEVPKAFVVPKTNSRLNSLNVHEYMAANAAKYKQLIGGIILVDSIPKTKSGKILRRQLK